MDDDSGAAGMKHGIRLALVPRDRLVDDTGLARAVRADRDVRHVARMSAARDLAVLLLLGIEVAAGRRDRRLAAAGLMDVEGAFSRRQALERQLDLHALLCLGQRRG